MKHKKVQRLIVTLILVTMMVAGASALMMKNEDIPSASREMRGVWVATVANIDWPSKPGLPVDEQKKEAIIILDRIKAMNMNAVVFQVRPQADALYPSDLEPWSYYLTGEQGKAPEPFYDPLKFWIDESHARGLEFHAWFNPYRAGHPAMKGPISPKSMIKTNPESVYALGSVGYYWMDPSLQEVQDHSFSVIMDVVKRYDVDAIHFDDYFYPYPEYNNDKDFPDDATYKAYIAKGGKLNRGDWRRDAVNKFIHRVYAGIHKSKPTVKLGISPFGIYRPGYPKTIDAKFDQYGTLYADAKLWFNKGWVDYYTPQLYWNISRVGLSYPLLVGWWVEENKAKRHLWPGIALRPENDVNATALELVNQIMITRGMIPEAPGNIIFSMKTMIPSDSTTGKALTEGPYAKQALMPSFPWLDSFPPQTPGLSAEKNNVELKVSWTQQGKEKPFLYVLYTETSSKWNYQIFPEKTMNTSIKLAGSDISAVAISAVDRCGNESKKTVVRLK